ncbi:MAG: hypothetical protein ACRDEA_07445 [Microcystaceae cyanobacterium]
MITRKFPQPPSVRGLWPPHGEQVFEKKREERKGKERERKGKKEREKGKGKKKGKKARKKGEDSDTKQQT